MAVPKGEHMDAGNIFAVLNTLAFLAVLPVALAVEGPGMASAWEAALSRGPHTRNELVRAPCATLPESDSKLDHESQPRPDPNLFSEWPAGFKFDPAAAAGCEPKHAHAALASARMWRQLPRASVPQRRLRQENVQLLRGFLLGDELQISCWCPERVHGKPRLFRCI